MTDQYTCAKEIFFVLVYIIVALIYVRFTH